MRNCQYTFFNLFKLQTITLILIIIDVVVDIMCQPSYPLVIFRCPSFLADIGYLLILCDYVNLINLNSIPELDSEIIYIGLAETNKNGHHSDNHKTIINI